MDSGLFIIFFSFLIAVGISAMIPFVTRRTENFGVSIPESLYDRTEFRNMRKKYAGTLIILGLLLCVFIIICSLFLSTNVIYIMLTAAILIFVLCSFGLYLPYHFKMKQIKEKEGWHTEKHQSVVVDMKFRNEKLVYSNWWFILPGIIIAGTIAITFIVYENIPDQIPMHTDISGNVTYDDKSITNLLFLPGTQVFILLLFLVINIIIKNAKQQVSAENPDKSKQQNILFRRRWSAYTIVSAMLMMLIFGYMQLTIIYPKLAVYEDIILMIGIGLMLAGTIILAINTGKGGSRINIDTPQDSGNVDRDNDRYWKLGQFYES